MTHDSNHMQRVLQAALRYARRGWPVLPVHAVVDGVCTCSAGEACEKPGKHPANGNGVNGAACDEAQIRQWFDGSRPRNLGVACGERSGLFALDIDAPEGEQWFEAVTGETPTSFPALKARTGLKTKQAYTYRGWHLFFRWTPEMAKLKNAAKAIPGVDWRTTGGYVVVEPSIHASGKHYEWVGDGEEAEAAEMPSALLHALLATTDEATRAREIRAGNWVIEEGRRNATLYRIGCGMRGRGEELDEIVRELSRINRTHCSPPLAEVEVESTASNACKHPKGADGPGSTDQSGAMTDLWMARQFLRDWGGLVHWVPEVGRWICWDEKAGVWRYDTDGQVNQWFRDTVSRIVRQFAAKVGGNTELVKVLKRLTSYHNHKPEQSALSMAATEPLVTVSISRLDAMPELLACGNCTVDLRSGSSRPNDPEDLLTKTTSVPYRPDAIGMVFGRFLADTFPDVEIGRYIQLALGSALIGRVREHHLHIAIGSGGNGKSTLLNAVMRVLGQYALTAPDGLLKPQSGRHSTDIVCLKGIRLAVAVESGETTVLDDEMIKRLTGGDQLTARLLYKDNITFTPTHHLWLMTNEEPRIGSVGRAMTRRLRLVPFLNEVPGGEEDVNLDDKLRREGPAILAWLVEGCRMYSAESLSHPPEAVTVATREYLAEQDVIKRFMELHYDRVDDPESRHRVPLTDVYDKFTQLRDNVDTSRRASVAPPQSRQSVAANLRRLGLTLHNGKGNKVYILGLKPK